MGGWGRPSRDASSPRLRSCVLQGNGAQSRLPSSVPKRQGDGEGNPRVRSLCPPTPCLPSHGVTLDVPRFGPSSPRSRRVCDSLTLRTQTTLHTYTHSRRHTHGRTLGHSDTFGCVSPTPVPDGPTWRLLTAVTPDVVLAVGEAFQ